MAAWVGRTWAFDSATRLPPLRPRAMATLSQGAFADQFPLELGQSPRRCPQSGQRPLRVHPDGGLGAGFGARGARGSHLTGVFANAASERQANAALHVARLLSLTERLKADAPCRARVSPHAETIPAGRLGSCQEK